MRHTLVLSALLGTGLLAATSMSHAANNSLVFLLRRQPRRLRYGAVHDCD